MGLDSIGRILSNGADAVSRAYRAGDQKVRDIGNDINDFVDSANDKVDEFQADLVEFGSEHGGPVGNWLAQMASDRIGLGQGVLGGAYDAVSGIVELGYNANQLTSPVAWIADPEANLDRLETTGNTVVALGSLTSPIGWALQPEQNIETATALWNGVTEGYQEAAAEGDWGEFSGRLAFDVLSTVGTGGAGAGIKAGQGSSALGRAARGLDDVADALPASQRVALPHPPVPPRVTNGVTLDPSLPDPVAGLGYKPQVLNSSNPSIANSHVNGYKAELELANRVAATDDVTVLKYGDEIGRHGSDVISVDSSGNITLWDSKYRSNDVAVTSSPTFKPGSQALSNAIDEARVTIQNSDLPADVKTQALDNLDDGNFTTVTTGAGQARNSVISVFENGQPRA